VNGRDLQSVRPVPGPREQARTIYCNPCATCWLSRCTIRTWLLLLWLPSAVCAPAVHRTSPGQLHHVLINLLPVKDRLRSLLMSIGPHEMDCQGRQCNEPRRCSSFTERCIRSMYARTPRPCPSCQQTLSHPTLTPCKRDWHGSKAAKKPCLGYAHPPGGAISKGNKAFLQHPTPIKHHEYRHAQHTLCNTESQRGHQGQTRLLVTYLGCDLVFDPQEEIYQQSF